LHGNCANDVVRLTFRALSVSVVVTNQYSVEKCLLYYVLPSRSLFPRESLLRMALRFPSVKLLDLIDCSTLDDEILEAILTNCTKVKVLILKSTKIIETFDIALQLFK
jgi:hypothetical protein